MHDFIRTLACAIMAGACLAASPVAAARQGDAPAGAAQDKEQETRNTGEYNLPKSGLAIRGYDPVAYFPEGGGEPKKGKESITLDYRGVTYRFATEANREAFKRNPKRYEPAYGGWCAWAMADGNRADVDPKSFIVKDGRLFLFFDGFFNDTRAKWRKRDHDQQASRADAEWLEQSGEEPRRGGETTGDADAP